MTWQNGKCYYYKAGDRDGERDLCIRITDCIDRASIPSDTTLGHGESTPRHSKAALTCGEVSGTCAFCCREIKAFEEVTVQCKRYRKVAKKEFWSLTKYLPRDVRDRKRLRVFPKRLAREARYEQSFPNRQCPACGRYLAEYLLPSGSVFDTPRIEF